MLDGDDASVMLLAKSGDDPGAGAEGFAADGPAPGGSGKDLPLPMVKPLASLSGGPWGCGAFGLGDALDWP